MRDICRTLERRRSPNGRYSSLTGLNWTPHSSRWGRLTGVLGSLSYVGTRHFIFAAVSYACMHGTLTASGLRQLRRSWTFVVVLAFHLGLIVALVRLFETQSFSNPIAAPLKLILLPRVTTPRTRSPLVLQDSFHTDAKISPIPIAPSPITIPQTAAPNERADSPIDWAGQAQKGAAAATPGSDVTSFDHRFPWESERPPNSIFEEPPARRAGEQFRTDDGSWVVYISENCYQISNPLESTSGLANGMGVQTYCKRKSKTPRGDLFEQLPAYKRDHPSP